MKHQIMLVIIASSSLQAATPSDCLLSVEPHWDNIESNCTHEKEFGGRWMLVGSITFRKKSKEQTKLETMKLSWHGKHIDHLYGSLYKKLPDKKFLPIEQNLVCDSAWNKARQELILNFKHNKQTLGPINIFYLVLTVPHEMEDTLRQGHFSVVKKELPAPFQSKANLFKIDLAQLSHEKDRKLSASSS
jgi:hypothetical protein